MRSLAFAGALVAALAGAHPVAAQQPTLDSTQSYYRDRLVALRDTTRAVGAAIVMFRRDLRTAGPETVVAKAARLVRTCAQAREAVLDAMPAFERRTVPTATLAAADTVRASARRLAGSLATLCIEGLSPHGPGSRADSLRAWGPYRTAQLRLALDRFQSNLQKFAGAGRIRLPVTSP